MKKILVVDDEARIRELLHKALNGKGYDVTTVPGAEQALTLIFQEPFDLVLLDIRLAGESGISVLKKIRESKGKVAIVVYSGVITQDLEREARAAGANEVISKNIEIPQLVEQIGKIVKAKDRIFEDPSYRKNKQILIVDDEEGVREVLSKFFKARGYKVLEAESGEKAVQLVGSEKISAVLLDMKMPGMDGLSTLEKLLKINNKLGVVIVTADGDDETVKKAIELGAYSYVLKPFDFFYLELVVMSKLVIAESA